MAPYKTKLHQIKAFAFDVDGVLTDGSVQVTESGDFLRTYNAKDGLAVRTAIEKGFYVTIITGGNSETIKKRFQVFGVTDFYMLSRIKLPDLQQFCTKYSLQPHEVLFMGDDLPDIPPMKYCGLPCCPADAVPEVKAAAEYISPYDGGKGCVRDIIEQTLKIQRKWMVDNAPSST
ncbi:MAG: HAD-IIIA family hydrolase [Prevotellaceae bacterium]|jgi:3-deoxy-D-manno-octulosonate 8-phosphate phosphatase (KDO 8-P phosphatase)|nr:HAD-IIIA family hydrolase [Prevotellaceae bacterium]